MPRKKAAASRKRWDSYEDYLQSEEWQAIRERVIARDKKCQLCESKKTLQGHHFRYPSDWALDTEDNVVLLCKRCHQMWHKGINQHIGFEDADSFIELVKRFKRVYDYHKDTLYLVARLVCRHNLSIERNGALFKDGELSQEEVYRIGGEVATKNDASYILKLIKQIKEDSENV